MSDHQSPGHKMILSSVAPNISPVISILGRLPTVYLEQSMKRTIDCCDTLLDVGCVSQIAPPTLSRKSFAGSQ
jgi:hypothetical protein